MPTGDTPAEQAAFIRDEANWIDVYTIATLLNVTSWSSVEDHGDVLFNAAVVEPYEFTFQNTTFEIKEIVFNRITTTSTTLPNNNWVTVQPDGTMMYEVSTETTCCICGRSFSVESIGQDFLLPISGSLSTCDTICNIEDEWCNDIAVELSRGGDVIEEIDDENSTDTESTAAAADTDTAIITTTTTTEPTTAIKATANATVISSESDNVVSNYTPPTIDIIIEPPNKGEDIPVDNKEAAQEASSGSMVFASILWVLVVCLVFGV